MESGDPVSQLRDNLICGICLELFTCPLTLPCGHSFCQKCIHEHWGRESVQLGFSCPECRLILPQRPEPQKNVSISKLLEDLRALQRSRARGPLVPAESGAPTTAPPLCQHHQQPLTLYCSTDQRCICSRCLLTGCRPHEVQDIGELCQERKQKLANDLQAGDRRESHIKEEIEKWRSEIENIKDFHEKMLSAMMAKFEQVRKMLDDGQMLVVDSVTCAKDAASTRAAEHVQLLQSHLTDLEKHRMEAEMLLGSHGNEFLEGLPQLVPVGASPESPNIQMSGNLQTEAVSQVLSKVSRLLQQELPNLLYPEKPKDKPEETPGTPFGIDENDACGVAGTLKETLHEQKTSPCRSPSRICPLRTQLCNDYRNLKFDPETANKYLEISHEDKKATHRLRSRRNNTPDSPKRFQTWQVLCTDAFSEGSHYWEVGISTFFVELGVAYDSLKRTTGDEGTIGRNSSSWSLQIRSMHHSVWHNNVETKLQSPMSREIGVHLDMTAGSLTFYGISDGRLQRLYSFSCIFSDKVFPVFWIGEDTNVTIRPQILQSGIV